MDFHISIVVYPFYENIILAFSFEWQTTNETTKEPQQKNTLGIHTISHIFVYFAFLTLSQLKFYNNWGHTDSLFTVQT